MRAGMRGTIPTQKGWSKTLGALNRARRAGSTTSRSGAAGTVETSATPLTVISCGPPCDNWTGAAVSPTLAQMARDNELGANILDQRHGTAATRSDLTVST